jgi:hypothetical protein
MRSKALQWALFIIPSLLAGPAPAVLPDNGWYWNPQESGRGFNIEIQNDVLFMSAFVYDADGHPLWIIAGGKMSSDRTFTGDVLVTFGGQCIGCPYAAPVPSQYGRVSITFTGASTATIVLNGTTINVMRQQFGWDFSSPPTPLLGEWAMVEGSAADPVYSGERITLSTTANAIDGLVAAGSRTGDASAVAISSYVASSNTWVMLMDSSGTQYRLYVFAFAAFDRIEGTRYLYAKGTQPTVGVNFIGQRIKSAAAVAGSDAPGTGKMRITATSRDSGTDDRGQASTGTVRAEAGIVELARRLEAVLEPASGPNGRRR